MMSWFKRKNEELNLGLEQELYGEGAAQAAPEPPSLGEPLVMRMNDSERLGYDAVNLPDHYKKFKIEPIRFCQENGLDANQTAIVKYVTRFRDKNGTEDLRKAARMLDMLIAFEEGDPDWWRLPGERASRRTYIV